MKTINIKADTLEQFQAEVKRICIEKKLVPAFAAGVGYLGYNSKGYTDIIFKREKENETR